MSKQKYLLSILVGIIVFILGVTGSLIAGWLQQDILGNAFTLPRLLVIFLITAIGVFITVVIENKNDIQQSNPKTRAFQNQFSGLRLLWSRLKTRGKSIQMEDISAIGSDIDIDTTK
jgi:hypothetical protein